MAWFKLDLVVTSPASVLVEADDADAAREIGRQIEDDEGRVRRGLCALQGVIFTPGDEIIEVEVSPADPPPDIDL